VSNANAAALAQKPGAAGGREGQRATTSFRANLIDTRLVQAELARLRGPRPATKLYSARETRSTVSSQA
jgi:hypothetical protein